MLLRKILEAAHKGAMERAHNTLDDRERAFQMGRADAFELAGSWFDRILGAPKVEMEIGVDKS